jgi:uracil-DNA glycosylase
MLKRRHVRPLMEIIRGIRSRQTNVPNIDPLDGGVEATVLFLLESPGPKAVGSMFVSRDNSDPTACNMRETLESARIARRETVLWNVVPHCISTHAKNGKPTGGQIIESIPDTLAFINALPNLKAIVFCGNDAKLQRSKISPRLLAGFKVFETYHLSARAFRAKQRTHVRNTFRRVRQYLDG